MNMASEVESPYILYYYPFSLCSLMTRLTYAWRGSPAVGIQDMVVELREVDIARKLEQFSEEFLCQINPKGKVSQSFHDFPAFFFCASIHISNSLTVNNRCQCYFTLTNYLNLYQTAWI